jgi:hypothetical protein
MIGALRQLAQRPIAERERRRLFALSATVVLCAAGLLFELRPGSAHDPDPAPPSAATRPDPSRPRPPAADDPDSPPSSTPRAGEGAGEPAAGRPRPDAARPLPAGLPPRVPAGVEHAARRFLGAYLPFLYGRGPARAVEPITAELRARLARSRVRVPPAVRRRHPRVVALRPRVVDGSRFAVSARVADGGAARYPIELGIARRGGRWRVVEAGGH